MYIESHDALKNRIQELENEVEKLRELIRQESVLEEYLEGMPLNNGQHAISVIDTNFTLIEVNAKRLIGTNFRRSELIGEKCYTVFYGLDKPCEECTVSQVVKSKKPDCFLKSYTDKNKIKFEEKSLSPVTNKTGRVERIVVQSKDISSYYHLVNSVEQREEFYKNIFESVGDAFLVHDEKGKLIEFSSRLPEMLEYSKKELFKLNIKDIDDPSFSMNFEGRIKQIEKSGSGIFETNLISKSGNRISVEVSVNMIYFSNINTYFVAIRNVEKRKIAEQKLRESEERFRTLVENALDLIMRFDKNHRHIFVNSSSLSILKIRSEEFIGKTHREMGFPKEMCNFWEKEINLSFNSKKQHSVEFSLDIENELHHFEWQLIPELNSEGECETLMAIARDITVRKRSEEVMNEAIKTKDKFFSIIAHDLKNPFNALLPIAKSLQMNCFKMTASQIQEASSLIYSSAFQEFNLLNNLLEWSRSQMGKITHQPKQIDLKQLVESNVLLHKAKANKKNISVCISSKGNTVAFADEYMIDTVIRNLYSNALKFTKPDGQVEIGIVNDGTAASISIKDNGIGISPENQKKLFRIDTNYTRVGTNEESGTGLGLILCKEFIEQNKGSISVESTFGRGSIFSVKLPVN